MNDAKRTLEQENTIACMDSWSKVRDLPTYSELLAALVELHEAEEAVFPPFEAGQAAQDAWAVRKTAAHFAAATVIAKATGSAQ